MQTLYVQLPVGIYGFETNYRKGLFVKAETLGFAEAKAKKSVDSLGLSGEIVINVFQTIRVLEVE